MVNIDLHTHSEHSPDGGISAAQYAQLLESGTLQCIAVTDHNSVDFALSLHEQYGDAIIVGSEIMSRDGEIIGLYLRENVSANMSAHETAQAIKAQGGLVYIPHPFETVRHGMHPAALEAITDLVDIIEVCNGRAVFQNRGSQALVWSRLNNVAGAASSDAHGIKGIGDTYTTVSELPTKETLVGLLEKSTRATKRASTRSILYPKYHRLRKKFGKKLS